MPLIGTTLPFRDIRRWSRFGS